MSVAGERGVPSVPDADDTFEARLGRHLRALRRARGLTLKQLAARADLSHPFLSQLERGLARPSMGSLERIAYALGTSRVELIAACEPRPDPGEGVSIVRAEDGVIGGYGYGTARLLATGPRRFEPLEFRGANVEAGDHFEHEEDEFITVLEGTVAVSLGDHGVHTLGPGDSLYCRSGTPHRWSSADGAAYRLLIIKERFGSHAIDEHDPPAHHRSQEHPRPPADQEQPADQEGPR